MLGISVFLNEPIKEKTKYYIKQAKELGAKGIFSSIHIPENDACLYKERLKDLGAIAKSLNLDLMIDISQDALDKVGFSFNDLSSIKDIGITGLRIDYGINTDIIAKASKEMTIALNASTLTDEFIEELKNYNANFSSFEMWHNYYPREDTGLDEEFFLQMNNKLKKQGFKVIAFIPGDEILRAPIFKGLPTIESHREKTPYFAFIDLINNYDVDYAYIGDSRASLKTLTKISDYISTNCISLDCKVIEDNEEIKNFVITSHQNRADFSKKVIRSANARFLKIPFIKPKNNIERKIGSVTIDNASYGRYTGEVQICKEDLPLDNRVNVIAKVIEEDIPLLNLIKANTKYKLNEV